MRKATLILFTLLSYSCYGQDYIIALQKHILDLPNSNFYISQVIDARLDKSTIGTVQTGIANSRKIAKFEKELPEELMSLFNRSLLPQEGKKPVILKVIAFQIKEKTRSFSEAAIVEMKLDFIYQNSAEEYMFLYQASTLSKKNGAEVTARHDENIIKALQDCFTQFTSFNIHSLIKQAQVMLPEELGKGSLAVTDTLSYPILHLDSTYKKGVYQNFIEFRSNNPGIVKPLDIEQRERMAKSWQGTYQIQPYILEADGKKRNPRKSWGFSDGENIYIHFRNEYYPLEKLGSIFTFDAHVPSDMPVVYTGGIITGVITAAATAAVAASATNNSKATYVLDIITGRIYEYGNYTYKGKMTGQGSSKIVFYFIGDKSTPDQSVQLSLSDKRDTLTADLQLNSSVELEWTEVTDVLYACDENNTNDCLTFLPQINQITYIECKPHSKNPSDSIEFKVVEEKVANFYLKKIKYLQEIADKQKNTR